ncbi:type II toxin-antitoxin system HicA family toxin [Candidatus Woesearchaeota archaeon]|nr:type II toxin-antitoxin system HicA family toxin [Candidatus Woesearchaeota archaeon]
MQTSLFIATRQKGSHVRLEKTTTDKLIKITVPLHSEMKKGTLNRIIKDAGLTLEEFEQLK